MTTTDEVTKLEVFQDDPSSKAVNILNTIANNARGSASKAHSEAEIAGENNLARNAETLAMGLVHTIESAEQVIVDPNILLTVKYLGGKQDVLKSQLDELRNQAEGDPLKIDIDTAVKLLGEHRGKIEADEWKDSAVVLGLSIGEAKDLLVALGSLFQDSDLGEILRLAGNKHTERKPSAGGVTRTESLIYPTTLNGARAEIKCSEPEKIDGTLDYLRASYKLSLRVPTQFIADSVKARIANN